MTASFFYGIISLERVVYIMARVSKEELKDGKILNELIQRFVNEPKGENLYPVLLCLVDSDVQVPMNAIISEEDAEAMKKSKVGDELSLQNELRFRPDWLQDPNTQKLYFPIFSTIKDATEDYSKNFSWMNMDIDTCINFADDNKDCSGIILNAFTTPIVIEGDIYKILKDLLEEERKPEPIELDKENIESIDYKNIIAVTIAEGGAMGEPNGFQVVDEFMQLYHSNFQFGKLKYDELKKKFPLLNGFNCGLDQVNNLDKGWKEVNLGADNYLLIRDKYYDMFMDRVKSELGENYKRGELYQKWFKILQKLIIIKK